MGRDQQFRITAPSHRTTRHAAPSGATKQLAVQANSRPFPVAPHEGSEELVAGALSRGSLSASSLSAARFSRNPRGPQGGARCCRWGKIVVKDRLGVSIRPIIHSICRDESVNQLRGSRCDGKRPFEHGANSLPQLGFAIKLLLREGL